MKEELQLIIEDEDIALDSWRTFNPDAITQHQTVRLFFLITNRLFTIWILARFTQKGEDEQKEQQEAGKNAQNCFLIDIEELLGVIAMLRNWSSFSLYKFLNYYRC